MDRGHNYILRGFGLQDPVLYFEMPSEEKSSNALIWTATTVAPTIVEVPSTDMLELRYCVDLQNHVIYSTVVECSH